MRIKIPQKNFTNSASLPCDCSNSSCRHGSRVSNNLFSESTEVPDLETMVEFSR